MRDAEKTSSLKTNAKCVTYSTWMVGLMSLLGVSTLITHLGLTFRSRSEVTERQNSFVLARSWPDHGLNLQDAEKHGCGQCHDLNDSYMQSQHTSPWNTTMSATHKKGHSLDINA